MKKSNHKLGLRELRDFISQLLFDNYNFIPSFRRELKSAIISRRNGLFNEDKRYRNNRILYLGSYTSNARNLMLKLKNASNSDSEFISELNSIYNILN